MFLKKFIVSQLLMKFYSLCNRWVKNRVHEDLQLDLVLTQLNPFPDTHIFSKMYVNIFHHLRLDLPYNLSSVGFSLHSTHMWLPWVLHWLIVNYIYYNIRWRVHIILNRTKDLTHKGWRSNLHLWSCSLCTRNPLCAPVVSTQKQRDKRTRPSTSSQYSVTDLEQGRQMMPTAVPPRQVL